MQTRFASLIILLTVAACSSDDDGGAIDASPDNDAIAASCPTHLEFESLGDLTRIDIGFSGLGHGGNLPTNTIGTYEVLECDEACRRCKFSGPVRNDTTRNKQVRQRCVGDLTQECTSDADCGAGDLCRFQLRTVNDNQAGQCNGVYFEPVPGFGDGQPVQGTLDLVTGEAQFTVANLALTTYAGGGCQTCEGDTTAFDGVPDGTCSVDGTPCDVSGQGGGPPPYVTSFDCPLPGPLVVTAPLPIPNIGSASLTWTLDSSRPACTGAGETGNCWCGVCEDFSPCFDDSQCATGTCGFAGNMGLPISSRNNLCDTTCDYDDSADVGSCVSTALGGITVPCFPDSGSITVRGGVEVGDGFFVTTLAGLACFPATGSPNDQILGLPGILYVQNVYRITPLTIAQ